MCDINVFHPSASSDVSLDDERPSEVFDVIIVGCGPTGAMLAAELRLHDVNVLVLERETEPVSAVRILGLHVRSLELMAMRGVLDRLLMHGRQRPAAGFFAGIAKPAPSLDTAHPYLLGMPQPVLVRLLEERALELGAQIWHGSELVDIELGGMGVAVQLANGQHVRAGYVVGCDGARSNVRKLLGVAFPGEPARTETLMGEMAFTAPADEIAGAVAEARAVHPSLSIGPSGEGLYRVVVPAAAVIDRTESPVLEDFKRRLIALAGTDFGVHTPRWMSRFGDATRLVDQYRVGRVLLAGDAAHIHPPAGGQGVNLGIQDACNLGWKLAAEIRGWAPETLLDTYHAERHPVAAAVLDNTRAQTVLSSTEPGPQALRRLLEELMDLDEVNRHLIAMITAIDVRYDFGDELDVVGRRLPDVELAQGRLYDRLRKARGLVIDRTERLVVGGWSDRVDYIVDASASVGAQCLLLRPDGHVAWVGDTQQELDSQLARWFGQPAT